MADALKRMIITVSAPETLDGKEGRQVLAGFYGELLGLRIVREDWLQVAEHDESNLRLALDGDGWSDLRPPRWPDPEYPQQLHLDLATTDLDAAGALAERLGAKLLQDKGDFRTYADPAGHPFCLYRDAAAGDGIAIARLVFDCFSPRALATFYAGLLGAGERTTDTPERVVLSLGGGEFPDLAFQHAAFVAARWPDPAYPAQLHVDWRFTDGVEPAQARAERLGAIRLPDLADTKIYADPASHPFCL
ncbi:VOC family protein [Flindersiella endophytica]